MFIVYNYVIDSDVLDAFKTAGIKAYTKLERIHGQGSDTEPKLGTQLWPGENNALFVAVSDEQIEVVVDLMKKIKRKHQRFGVKGFLLPVDEIF